MKRILTIVAAMVLTASVFAQTPEKMSYQAIIRDANNNLIVNQSVGLQISILQGSTNGTAVYVETHNSATNANGLVSIEIGAGTLISGDFKAINWANGLYFIKTETDPTGGTSYTITGTSQLLSVPYALYAKNAENGFSGNYTDLSQLPANIDEDETNDVILTGNQTITGNKTFTGKITVPDPVNALDAVNKEYVDLLLDRIIALEVYAGIIPKDGDGNIYTTVKIGNQVWFAENLRTTRYLNGDLIGTTSPATIDISTETAPKYQWAYNGEESYVTLYGRLYTGYTVADGRQLCPSGWHIPTSEEWTVLTEYLTNNGYGYEGSGDDVAKALAATSDWLGSSSPGVPGNDMASNNISGFTAYPGGRRLSNGLFEKMSIETSWWSSTEDSYGNITLLWMANEYNSTIKTASSKAEAFSVRCVKD